MREKYNLWLSCIAGVNPSNGKAIMESGLCAEEIVENRANLDRYNIFTPSQKKRAAEITPEYIARLEKRHRVAGIKSVSCFDEDYPKKLKEIYNLPVVLFYKGNLSIAGDYAAVSVIGSRHCTGEGERAAEVIAADVAAAGGIVVSGLAQGIDTIAHKSSVAAGGKTIAVTGVPLDEYFPKTNMAFQKKLEIEHLVLSEYPSGYKYHGSNFVHRNRIIAALGDRLCVVQAKRRSGSMATVNDAEEYSRPIFTIPGSIFDSAYEGSNDLLVKNIAMAATDGKMIMEFISGTPYTHNGEEATDGKQNLPTVSEVARQVLECIKGAMFTPAIIQAAGLSVGLVKGALTELEIYGYVQKTTTGEYIRCD